MSESDRYSQQKAVQRATESERQVHSKHGLGGSRDGKGFPEEVAFLLGLEGQAGRKSMTKEKEEQQLPGWEQHEQRRREARTRICHLVA